MQDSQTEMLESAAWCVREALVESDRSWLGAEGQFDRVARRSSFDLMQPYQVGKCKQLCDAMMHWIGL